MQQQQQIKISLDNNAAEGTYANLALIAYSPSEIILDFARIMPGMKSGKVFSRVIMTPAHAKLFLNTLQENVKKFENQFGEIKTHGQQPKNIGFETSASERDETGEK